MTEIYCRVYDKNLNIIHVFKNYNEFRNYHIDTNPIHYYPEIHEFCTEPEFRWFIHCNAIDAGVLFTDWFESYNWNPIDGFDTEEKKLLFRLKFL